MQVPKTPPAWHPAYNWDTAPYNDHIHVDQFGLLEDGSDEIVVQRLRKA